MGVIVGVKVLVKAQYKALRLFVRDAEAVGSSPVTSTI